MEPTQHHPLICRRNVERQNRAAMETFRNKYNYVIQVDDDPFVISRQKLIIQKKKLSPFFRTARHGKMAIRKLKEMKDKGVELPNYIVLDMNMPKMNGIQFLEAFRKEFYNNTVPTKIIIASSSLSSNDNVNTNEYPFVIGFIRKPLPGGFIEELITRPTG